MAKKQFEKMNDEELQQAIYDLGDQRNQIAEEMRQASAEQQKRKTQASARRKYEALSDPERQALMQMIAVEPIESGEVVNEV